MNFISAFFNTIMNSIFMVYCDFIMMEDNRFYPA